MSIKTTHSVTREFAIQAIMVKLNSCDNAQLANILEEAIHNGFYNFSIVESLDDDPNQYYINSLADLPEPNNAY